jgi:hypothetical protein
MFILYHDFFPFPDPGSAKKNKKGRGEVNWYQKSPSFFWVKKSVSKINQKIRERKPGNGDKKKTAKLSF